MAKTVKVNKAIYIPKELLADIERYRKDNGLTTFNSAANMLLTKALRK